jgi:peptidoglycan hydrolase-like protein with peptidoglycan-binding domain
VSWLQRWLYEQGYYPKDVITGYYGALTETAVQTFQAKNGIVSSGSPATTGYGSVGPKTEKLINSRAAGD